MSMQNFSQAESASTSPDILAAWWASGGAIEALADVDFQAAGDARSRQGGVSGDDGLQASNFTRYACVSDDGLAATMNTALASCDAESGLQANRPTTAFPFCADDGLQATMNTALASCLDDGPQAGRVAFNATTCL